MVLFFSAATVLLFIACLFSASVENPESIIVLEFKGNLEDVRVNYFLEPITIQTNCQDGQEVELKVGSGKGELHGKTIQTVSDGQVVFKDIMYDRNGLLILQAVHTATGRTATLPSVMVGQGRYVKHFDPPSKVLDVAVSGEGKDLEIYSEEFGLVRKDTGDDLTKPTECDVDIETIPKQSGCDLIYTISNPTDTPLALPELTIPGHMLHYTIQYIDQRMGCYIRNMNTSKNWVSGSYKYPAGLFAPVTVFKDTRFAMGLTCIYPIMEYKHQIEMGFVRGSQSGGSLASKWWTTWVRLNDDLEPGGSRTYTLTIRYTLPEDWIHTIKPYQEYFQDTYGYVRYEQDMRPSMFVKSSDYYWTGEDNPRGFSSNRPDLKGHGPKVNSILNSALNKHFQRTMVWSISGEYRYHKGNNYPVQINTEWTDRMIATEEEWKRIPDAGVELCFWWGRSAQDAYGWDDDKVPIMDIHNETQARRHYQEWELSLERGATGLGLDAITYMAPWDLIPWIERMWEIYPDAFFGFEADYCDIMSIYSAQIARGDNYHYSHLTADYLTPGREYWALLVTTEDNHFGNALALMNNGFTICIGTKVDAQELMDAATYVQCGLQADGSERL